MATQDDVLFGQIAVRRNLASSEQVAACLKIQNDEAAAGKARRTLGEILLAYGHITAPQVEMVLEEQRQLRTPRMIGNYQLLKKLGEGGMGAVYHARLPSTGLEVALKTLSSRIAKDRVFLSRFHREAETGLKLDHPNIIHTFDIGEDKGVHFMAQELVEGGDLEQRVKNGPLPERTCLRIISEVCRALQYAHEHGILHRDIKPTNIMFDKEGHAKLGDLGLVKFMDPEAAELTTTGTLVGTPQYISPEQARGEKDLDIRSDIYSLGATFYRIVSGAVPFAGGSALEVIARRLTDDLISPRQINPAVSEGATAVITKMMARERANRYAQPADVLHDAERVAAGRAPERAAIPAGKSSIQMAAVAAPAAASEAPPRKRGTQPQAPVGPMRSRANPVLQMTVAAAIGLAMVAVFALFWASRGGKSANSGETPAQNPAGQNTAGQAATQHAASAPQNSPAPAPAPAPSPVGTPPRPAGPIAPAVPGLLARYYEAPGLARLEGFDISKARLLGSQSLNMIDISGADRLRQLFGRDRDLLAEISGALQIPVDADWTFYLTSDGSSRLYIDEREVINHDGRHATSEAKETVALKAGAHAIRIQYAPLADGRLNLAASGGRFPRSTVPPIAFSHVASEPAGRQ